MWGDCWFGYDVSATEKCSWMDTCSGLMAFMGTSSLLERKRKGTTWGNGLYATVLYSPLLLIAWWA